jgi:hypothetical protein
MSGRTQPLGWTDKEVKMTKSTQGKFTDGKTYSIRPYKNGWRLTIRRDGKYLIAFTVLDGFVLEQMVASYELTGDYFDIYASYEINVIQPYIRAAYAAQAAC